MHRITHLTIRNFRGISELDVDVPPNGAIFAGSNGQGKTSALKAIRAALAANDIGGDAVKLGEDRAEILIDMDDFNVRRAITKAGGGSLKVTRGDFVVGKPQTWLTELLGGAVLDPLDWFLNKPKERRAQIVAVFPCTVTVDQLRKWMPDLPADTDCAGHGLEVVERIRKGCYDQRTVANAAAKKARDEADRAAKTARELAAGVVEGAPAIEVAAQEYTAAVRAREALVAQDAEASRATERGAKTRAKIAELRERSAGTIVPPVDGALESAWNEAQQARSEVARLEAELAAARVRVTRTHAAYETEHALVEGFKTATARAEDLKAQAAELEATLEATTAKAVPVEDMEAASRAIETAAQREKAARDAVVAADAKAHATRLAEAAKAAEVEASRLDRIVRSLTDEAPAALLQSANAIKGLSLDGDDIKLDGVSINALSGAEQMRFAVEIARRANEKSKLLVVDGLERLDVEQMEQFVQLATRDGWQLLATKVDRGALRLDVIAATPAAAAAE